MYYTAYSYLGCWIQLYLECTQKENVDNITYVATIELPNQGGVVTTDAFPSSLEAFNRAEQLIEGWENESDEFVAFTTVSPGLL